MASLRLEEVEEGAVDGGLPLPSPPSVPDLQPRDSKDGWEAGVQAVLLAWGLLEDRAYCDMMHADKNFPKGLILSL